MCVCVCVCSQASRSRATLSCDNSYFSYWQGTIQASYAVMRQLLLHNIVRQFSKTGIMYVTFMMAIGCVFFLKMCIFVLDEL